LGHGCGLVFTPEPNKHAGAFLGGRLGAPVEDKSYTPLNAAREACAAHPGAALGRPIHVFPCYFISFLVPAFFVFFLFFFFCLFCFTFTF
jgi:hypothetical protein